MKLKQLTDLANTLAIMLGSGRGSHDIEVLATCPEGTLSIDLLSEKAVHSNAGELNLLITREFSSWFKSRLKAYDIPESELIGAEVKAEIERRGVGQNGEMEIWTLRVSSCLSTSKRAYSKTFTNTWRVEQVKGRWFYAA